VLAREERDHGAEARQKLQDTLLRTEQLDDVMAALAFLKRAPKVDPHRLALAGHSFGGQLTLLAAARDPSVRAAVTFAAAAGSWPRSAELRRTLREAVAHTRCPILLVQWSNDFSTEPGLALGKEAGPGNPPPRVLLYPALGSAPEQGHDGVYLAMDEWERDVLDFLDGALSR
jgi:pimeloyl-ACP methyl ester carboxylesterase